MQWRNRLVIGLLALAGFLLIYVTSSLWWGEPAITWALGILGLLLLGLGAVFIVWALVGRSRAKAVSAGVGAA